MNVRLILMGTGAAMPIARSLPCIALKIDSDIYLIDPGEGCQIKMFKMGLSPLKVKVVIISHGHGDHYLGLPGLIQSMTLSNRREPLLLIAPRQLAESLATMFKIGLIRPGFKIEIQTLSSEYTYSDQKIYLKSFPVDHGAESYGFQIAAGKKKICYTGDTAPSNSVVENCKDVDVLIHEATFTSMYEKEAHEQKHSTSTDAAKIALKAGAKMLILFHISARHSTEEVFMDAYRYFKNTLVATDGMIIAL